MKKGVSGTKEWASTNENIVLGCENGCLYCFACANAVRFDRKASDDWTREEVVTSKLTKGFGRRKGTIMFPTTHDFTENNLQYTLPYLLKILKPGNDVLVVSKPRLPVIQKICDACGEYKEQILFRFTIGSGLNEVLEFWEPGAPGFMSRLESLSFAFCNGFKTSVSMEPLLDIEEDVVVATVEALEPYVNDAIWIGKMNRPGERLKRNGHWDKPRVKEMVAKLIASQTDTRIRALHERLKENPLIKWKESIKKVVGIEVPTEAGLDI